MSFPVDTVSIPGFSVYLGSIKNSCLMVAEVIDNHYYTGKAIVPVELLDSDVIYPKTAGCVDIEVPGVGRVNDVPTFYRTEGMFAYSLAAGVLSLAEGDTPSLNNQYINTDAKLSDNVFVPGDFVLVFCSYDLCFFAERELAAEDRMPAMLVIGFADAVPRPADHGTELWFEAFCVAYAADNDDNQNYMALISEGFAPVYLGAAWDPATGLFSNRLPDMNAGISGQALTFPTYYASDDPAHFEEEPADYSGYIYTPPPGNTKIPLAGDGTYTSSKTTVYSYVGSAIADKVTEVRNEAETETTITAVGGLEVQYLSSYSEEELYPFWDASVRINPSFDISMYRTLNGDRSTTTAHINVNSIMCAPVALNEVVDGSGILVPYDVEAFAVDYARSFEDEEKECGCQVIISFRGPEYIEINDSDQVFIYGGTVPMRVSIAGDGYFLLDGDHGWVKEVSGVGGGVYVLTDSTVCDDGVVSVTDHCGQTASYTVNFLHNPIYFYPVSPLTMVKNQISDIDILGGSPPFTVNITGTGFYLLDDLNNQVSTLTEAGRAIRVLAGDEVCGGTPGSIMVIDSCEKESDSFVLLNELTEITLNAPATMARSEMDTVIIYGGSSPFRVHISGVGFFLLDGATQVKTLFGVGAVFNVQTDGTACGAGVITVTGSCGQTATATIFGTIGHWGMITAAPISTMCPPLVRPPGTYFCDGSCPQEIYPHPLNIWNYNGKYRYYAAQTVYNTNICWGAWSCEVYTDPSVGGDYVGSFSHPGYCWREIGSFYIEEWIC